MLNKMINHIGDELVLVDQEARIVFANDASVKALGYPRENLLKKRVLDFYKNKMSLKEWQQKRFQFLKQKRTPISFRLERIVKDGREETVEITAVYMTYQDKEYLLAIGRDITHQLEIQRQLLESQERYQILCEGAGDPIFTLDLKERISYVNPAGEKFLGLSKEKIIGKDFYHFIDKHSWAALKNVLVRVKKSQNQSQVEFEMIGKSHVDPVPVEMVISPLQKKNELQGTHLIVRDIRQRRELELLLRESEKMQAIQFLVSGMAQELEHPLLGILTQTQTVLKKYQCKNFEYMTFKDYEQIIQTLQRVCRQMEYCYHATDQLLALKQKKIGLRKDFSRPHQVIQEILDAQEPFLKASGIRVVLHFAKNLPAVAMGKVDLAKVIENVIENAIHAMPAGGILTIGTRFWGTSGKVRMEIKDTGVGIPEEDLKSIFDPFAKKEQGERGLKLGLSVVHSLVSYSHGETRIVSSLRRGTTVTIELPAVKNLLGS
ncbi:MAG: PAS domain S-box protein [Candidatus Omnitrophica bacterium]|nr:PAS domain S-box protein [Candidatus Omnitrophota bacterium]